MKITITTNRKQWSEGFRTAFYAINPRLAADLEQYETMHVTHAELAAIDSIQRHNAIQVVNVA